MIKKELLVQLGWSDELIAEVTRIASDIDRNQPVFPVISQSSDVKGDFSSDSIYYDLDQTDTLNKIISR